MSRADINRLIRLLQSELDYPQLMRQMTAEEATQYNAKRGDFDLIIGDYGITNITERARTKERN